MLILNIVLLMIMGGLTAGFLSLFIYSVLPQYREQLKAVGGVILFFWILGIFAMFWYGIYLTLPRLI